MSKWALTWGFVPLDLNCDRGTLLNHTSVAVIRNNLNGSRIRIKFFNMYGTEDMKLARAAVQTRNRNTGKCSAYTMLLKDGSEEIVIPAGEQFYSDETALAVTQEDDLIVSVYFREKTVIRSYAMTNRGSTWTSYLRSGDFMGEEPMGMAFGALKPDFGPGVAGKAIGFSDIAVYTDDDVKQIAFFGDSITHMGYFTGPLALRLYETYPGKVAVTNAGISGNRIQRGYPNFPGEGGGHQFGIAGKDRLETDVYLDMTPDIIYLMEGVNDCSHSILGKEYPIPTADEIYAALKEVIGKAQARGTKVYIGTISPFGAWTDPWRREAEELRCGLNEVIRGAGDADDMIDIDLLMRDPDNIHFMQEGMHFGDGVHPNVFGGQKMADAIFEKWFKEGI